MRRWCLWISRLGGIIRCTSSLKTWTSNPSQPDTESVFSISEENLINLIWTWTTKRLTTETTCPTRSTTPGRARRRLFASSSRDRRDLRNRGSRTSCINLEFSQQTQHSSTRKISKVNYNFFRQRVISACLKYRLSSSSTRIRFK